MLHCYSKFQQSQGGGSGGGSTIAVNPVGQNGENITSQNTVEATAKRDIKNKSALTTETGESLKGAQLTQLRVNDGAVPSAQLLAGFWAGRQQHMPAQTIPQASVAFGATETSSGMSNVAVKTKNKNPAKNLFLNNMQGKIFMEL